MKIRAVTPQEVSKGKQRHKMNSVIESINEQLFKEYCLYKKTAEIKAKKLFKIFKEVGKIKESDNQEYMDVIIEVYEQAGWKVQYIKSEDKNDPDAYAFIQDDIKA